MVNSYAESILDILLPARGIQDEFDTFRHVSFKTLYYNIYTLDRVEGTDDRATVTRQELSFAQPFAGYMMTGEYTNEQYYGSFQLDTAFRSAGVTYGKESFALSLKERIGSIFVSESILFSDLPGMSIGIILPFDSIEISDTITITGERAIAETLVIDTYSTIPLSLYFAENSLCCTADIFEIVTKVRIPLEPLKTAPFQPDLEGFELDMLASLSIEPFTIKGYIDYSTYTASLYYNNSHYCNIDELSSLSWYCSAAWNIDRQTFITAGVTSFDLAAGTGSYVSTTPFYESAGLYPNKYVINEFKANLLIPYAGGKIGIRLPSILSWDIFCTYYYLTGDARLRYSEREYIVYPFLFQYVPHDASLTIPIDSLLKIRSEITLFLTEKSVLSLGIFLLVPFSIRSLVSGEGSTNPGWTSKSTGTGERLTGGFAFSIGLTFLQ